jgi:hypothetical protein
MSSIKEADGYTTKNENKLLPVIWHRSSPLLPTKEEPILSPGETSYSKNGNKYI